jgi:hypothetical protein
MFADCTPIFISNPCEEHVSKNCTREQYIHSEYDAPHVPGKYFHYPHSIVHAGAYKIVPIKNYSNDLSHG